MKTTSLRWTASLAAMIALVFVAAGCVSPQRGRSASAKPGAAHVLVKRHRTGQVALKGRTGRGAIRFTHYIGMGTDVGQPQPFSRLSSSPSTVISRGQIAHLIVHIPASTQDTSVDLTFVTYRSEVQLNGTNLVLSQSSQPVPGSDFDTSDPSFYGGNDEFDGLDMGTDFDIFFKMSSTAPLGQYTIHGLGEGSSGINGYGTTFTFILVDSSSPAATAQKRKPARR